MGQITFLNPGSLFFNNTKPPNQVLFYPLIKEKWLQSKNLISQILYPQKKTNNQGNAPIPKSPPSPLSQVMR